MATKIPRKGTRIRAALEKWLHDYSGEVTFTEFIDVLCRSRHYGMYPTAVLKRFGRKLGEPGDRTKWVINPQVADSLRLAAAVV